MGQEHWITPTYPGGVRFRWQGVMDFGEFYRYLKWILQDHGLIDNDGFTPVFGGPKKTMETKFVERRMAGGLKNLEIEWKVFKKSGNYFKYNVWITILILGMKDEEVELNGVKRKLDRADYDIRMGANVETAADEEWEKMGVFKKIYYNFFVAKRLQVHKRDLYILFYRLNNDVKEYITKPRY